MMKRVAGFVCSLGLVLALGGTAQAQIYSENFDAIAGTFNGVQYQSGNALAANANLTGWSKAGAGAIHAVNHDGAGDLAPMLWGGSPNILTLNAAIAGSNVGGTFYTVAFDASPSVYQAGSQASTAADGVLVEVLRGDNSVLASHTTLVTAWAGNMAFAADSFQYTGDGTGDIRLRLTPVNPSNSRFGAGVDNLTLSVVPAAPVILSNTSTSDERLSRATLNGTLGVASTNADVYVYWGPTDGTTNTAAWTNSAYVGSWTNVASTNLSYAVTGLDHSTSYFYTFRATNDGTNVWASPSTSFSTLTPTVFTENFNSLTPGGAGTQADTGLGLTFGGSLAGWSLSGAGTIHAANLDGGGDWAVMFYQDNVLTLTTGIAANQAGVTYNVEFDYGTAVYSGLSQKTEATDSLLVEVLRGDNSVLASATFAPGTWGFGNYNLDAGLHGTLQYVGDGSGVVRLRLGPTPPYNSGNFEGEIDNVSVTIYEATQLAFTTQPGNGTAGGPLAAQPVVELQDVLGNVVTTETSTVTLAIGTDAGPGATLSGTPAQAAVAGVADYSTNALSIDLVGSGYTLVASAGSLPGATSAVFDVTSGAGAPAKLAFTTQPGGGANHAVWGTQPAVTLQDASGIAVTGLETNITVSILNDAGPGATLSGTQTIAVDTNTGVATFTDLSIDLVGSGYTLEATASGLTSATSAVFSITVGPAAQLAFTTQPTNGYTDSAFLQLPAVTLQDAYGNTVVGTAQNVTLAIQNNAGPGATLSGTTIVAVDTSTGVATFDGLSIDRVGTGYTLTATGNTVQTTPGVVVSSAFDIQAGTAWSLANDFTLATNNSSSTWSFRLGASDADPKPTQLLTTNTRNANQLWATDFGSPPTMWSDASSYYGIGKNTTGATQTRSLGPNVSWAPNEVLLWPKNTSGTGGFPGRLVISWLAPFSTTVNIDYSWGTATSNGNGVGLRVWHESTVLKNWSNPYPNPDSGTVSSLEVAAGDRLYFEYDSWNGQDDDVTRTAITITTLPATQLAFSTQPGNGTAGSPLAVQPAVELQDVNGHKITKEASTVTLAIGNDAGPGAVLSGTLSQAAVAGTADFSTNALTIDKEGVGYTLVATAGTLTSATSAVFNVNAGVGAPAKLEFTTQPSGGNNNVAWSTQPQVTLQDASGLTVVGVNQNVTLSISNNPAGGTLNGTVTVGVDTNTGIATFSGLNIDEPGSGYTLVASGGALTNDVSSPFDITIGPAAKLAFTTQPGDGLQNLAFSPQPAVTLQDAFGYTVTGTAQNVTLAIENNAGPGGVLSGTLTRPVDTVTGVATFSGLNIDKTGTGYTLTATGNTVSTTPGVVVSSGFNISYNPYLLFEDFNGYSGNQNLTQAETGLELAVNGNVPGWTAQGAGVIHAVDLANLGGQSNPSDWAIMFFQDNVITLNIGIAANDAGVIYSIDFDYGTAVYSGLDQKTEATDSLLVEVLRGDSSVLASNTFAPGTWGAGNYNLDAGLQGTLRYIGDGSGNVRLRIGPTPPYTSGNFEGEIDNLSVSLGAAIETLFKFR